MDYKSRFNFHTTPFTREIAVKDLFKLSDHDKVLDDLTQVIENRMSGVLVAPAGCGKTTLLRALRKSLPSTRYRVHYLKVTDVSQRDLCREISHVAGAKPSGNYPALVRNVQQRIEEYVDNEGIRPVLLVDEAHELRPGSLRMFRILTNFAMDSKLVLSIIFVGQKRLRDMLKDASLEDIAKRMAHYSELRSLSRDEIKTYMKHRCHTAGCLTIPFDDMAHDAIYEISRGNMRAVDNLALKSLIIANNNNDDIVTANSIIEARSQLWPS